MRSTKSTTNNTNQSIARDLERSGVLLEESGDEEVVRIRIGGFALTMTVGDIEWTVAGHTGWSGWTGSMNGRITDSELNDKIEEAHLAEIERIYG